MKDRITQLRKDRGWTQDEFAEKIGISKNYVSLIENGKKIPGDKLISYICREFMVSEEWLRTGIEPKRQDYDIEFADLCFQIGIKDKNARKVLENYLELNEDDKKLFLNFLDFLSKKDGKQG